jgi:hypothetical protein
MSDADLLALLQRDPALTAQVLLEHRLAVRSGHRVRVAAPFGAVLGGIYPLPDGWAWWVHWRAAEGDQPRGAAPREQDAWSLLVAALECREWTVIDPGAPLAEHEQHLVDSLLKPEVREARARVVAELRRLASEAVERATRIEAEGELPKSWALAADGRAEGLRVAADLVERGTP